MSVDPDCLGMCAIDGDVCTGCGRTLDQINAALGGDDEDCDGQDDGQTAGGQTAGSQAAGGR